MKQLKKFILKLNDYKSVTTWDTYSVENSYTSNADQAKKEIVKNFFNKNNFNLACDLGCNDGIYSEIALRNKCQRVVGFDFDINSVDKAYWRSKKKQLNFLPLYFDATNPSANIGWDESERMSFKKRAKFDAVIALAFEHHLTLAKNIPLEQVIKWITSLAPAGLIEFVPKSDVTVKKMLELKGDIFPNYNFETFENELKKENKIISKNFLSESGRVIYEYKK